GMRKLSTDELKKMQDRGDQFALINVLPANDFNQTRIPGARNIPLEDGSFMARVEQAAGGKDRTVVVYCASEQCPSSTTAAERLEAGGFTKVFVYKGGAAAWQEADKATAMNV